MAVLHAVPSVRDMPPAPQSPLPMYFAPVFAGMGVAGLAAVSWELPAILLLCSTGERSSPDSLFQDAPEGWRVTWRKGLGPDTGFQWVSLRFSDALDFTPVPERFVVTGQTYDWNWTHAQRYEVTYTTQFHLVVSAVPVGGAP